MNILPFYVHCVMWLTFLMLGIIELMLSQLIVSAGALAMGLAFYRYCQSNIENFNDYWLRPLLITQIGCSAIIWIVALYIL